MNNHINQRMSALFEAIERRNMEQKIPVDGLSKSLYEFEDKMAALDETGIAALAAEAIDEDGKQILTLEQARAFVDMFKKNKR